MRRNIPASLLTESFSDQYITFTINKMKLLKSQGYLLILFSLFFLILFSGCANNEVVDQCLAGHKYGFFGGLWHGFIILFSLIGSIFTDVRIYSFPNSGGWYDFGFFLGASAFLGGSGASAS